MSKKISRRPYNLNRCMLGHNEKNEIQEETIFSTLIEANWGVPLYAFLSLICDWSFCSTQLLIRVPSDRRHGRQKRDLHWSYQRYEIDVAPTIRESNKVGIRIAVILNSKRLSLSEFFVEKWLNWPFPHKMKTNTTCQWSDNAWHMSIKRIQSFFASKHAT